MSARTAVLKSKKKISNQNYVRGKVWANANVFMENQRGIIYTYEDG